MQSEVFRSFPDNQPVDRNDPKRAKRRFAGLSASCSPGKPECHQIAENLRGSLYRQPVHTRMFVPVRPPIQESGTPTRLGASPEELTTVDLAADPIHISSYTLGQIETTTFEERLRSPEITTLYILSVHQASETFLGNSSIELVRNDEHIRAPTRGKWV